MGFIKSIRDEVVGSTGSTDYPNPDVKPLAPVSYGNMGQELLNIPFGEMVTSMGTGIAQSQYELDLVSAGMAQLMAGMPIGTKVEKGKDTGEAITVTVDFGDEKNLSLLELGFTPTFYQFTEAVIDVKMTLNYSSEMKSTTDAFTVNAGAGFSANATWQQYLGAETGSARLNVSTMNASSVAKYSIKAEGMSALRTTMVPVPAPAILEEKIRAVIEKRNAARAAKAGGTGGTP